MTCRVVAIDGQRPVSLSEKRPAYLQRIYFETKASFSIPPSLLIDLCSFNAKATFEVLFRIQAFITECHTIQSLGCFDEDVLPVFLSRFVLDLAVVGTFVAKVLIELLTSVAQSL